MSIKPGTTSLPRASIVWAAPAAMLGSTAAMRPLAMAMSRTASSRTDGSMTRPPRMTRSYFAVCAANRRGARANAAAAVATDRNCRRFNPSPLIPTEMLGAMNRCVNSRPRTTPHVHVRQVLGKRIGCVMRTQRSHDDRQRLGPDLREIDLPGRADREGQPFDRRRELRVDVTTIAARIDPIPPRIRQPHAVQSVEAEWCSAAIEAEALVTES